MTGPKLTWRVTKRHGFELHEARVVDADGAVLFRCTRWSEAGARTAAERWWNDFQRSLVSKV